MISNDKIRGYVCGAISGASYGLIPLFSLPIMRQGVDSNSLLLYRYLMAAVAMWLIMWLRGKSSSLKLKRDEVWFMLLLGVLFALSSVFMFEAFNYMPTGLISTMFFIYPILTVLIMTIFYGEQLTWGKALSLSMAIAGIAMLYVGDGSGHLSIVGVALTFAAALVYALYIVATNKSRLRKAAGSKMAFWSFVVGCIVFFVRSGFGANLAPVESVEAWGLILLLALVPTVISCTALVLSIRYVGSTATSILGALEPVTAVTCGVLFFAEPISLRITCGVLLIIAAVVLLIASDEVMARLRSKFKKKAF